MSAARSVKACRFALQRYAAGMTLSFLPPARGFLGLPPSAAFSASQAKSVLIPFGLEQSVSYEGGTAQGPQAIIDCSPQLELFDDELWREPH